jgi:hypothetical protein
LPRYVPDSASAKPSALRIEADMQTPNENRADRRERGVIVPEGAALAFGEANPRREVLAPRAYRLRLRQSPQPAHFRFDD